MAKFFNADDWTGGTADHDLDAITGYADGDPCIVINGGIMYLHQYDTAETGAESAPDIVIPDDNATGTGAWVLRKTYLSSDQALGVITTDTTFYVATTGNDTTGDGSSGSPWATLSHAYDYLGDYIWDTSNVSVTIQLGDGEFVETAPIYLDHICGASLYITGENTYTKSMTSVQSSSGSIGAWSVIINLDSVANIAVDDEVLITGAANGTKPTFIAGCHNVTNVDAVNTRITIASKHYNATAPSGAVTATVEVIKTRIKNISTNCFEANASDHKIAGISNLTIEATGYKAIYVKNGGCVVLGSNFGVVSATNGLYAEYGGIIIGNSSTISGIVSYGVVAYYGSLISFTSGICSGLSTQYLPCVFAYCNSTIIANSAVVTGSYGDGLQVHSGSRIEAYSVVVTGHPGTGIYAARYGYILAPGYSGSDNGANVSPTANTQGNEYGYIDT